MKRLFLSILAFSIVVLTVTPALAHSGKVANDQWATLNVQGRTVAVPVDLANRIASGASVSMAELAQAGITPGMPPTDGPPVRTQASFQTSAGVANGGLGVDAVTPASHAGCNLLVCINVQGSGLYVDTWSTSGSDTRVGQLCTFPTYWKKGSVWFTGQVSCHEGPGTFGDIAFTERNFDNGAELCNTWAAIPGRPCATVHS